MNVVGGKIQNSYEKGPKAPRCPQRLEGSTLMVTYIYMLWLTGQS
jgi:hypothetical protein